MSRLRIWKTIETPPIASNYRQTTRFLLGVIYENDSVLQRDLVLFSVVVHLSGVSVEGQEVPPVPTAVLTECTDDNILSCIAPSIFHTGPIDVVLNKTLALEFCA